MERPRAVLTGLGPVTPIGIGRAGLLAGLRKGQSATTALTELPGGFSVDGLESRITARVDDARMAEHASLPDADRRIVFADLALRLALADAGLTPVGGERTALVLGNAVGAPIPVETIFRHLSNGGLDPAATPPPLLDHMSFHSPAALLARRCRAGRVLTVSTGCTAGIDAVGLAYELIRGGGADVVITGSAEAPLTPVVFAAFDRIGALSCCNDQPERASRPFDRRRDGFVLAEGAALMILEERRHALARGARIYAEITGFASLSNAYHMTDLPADGAALAECIRRALRDAELAPERIDHVNAHGSSTPQNDLCETNAVKGALGARAAAVTVNSLKAMIGHALGASNAIEVAACALSLSEGFLFPTANLEEPGDGCDLDYVAGAARDVAPRNIVKLSSGFSGIHSALVLSATEETG